MIILIGKMINQVNHSILDKNSFLLIEFLELESNPINGMQDDALRGKPLIIKLDQMMILVKLTNLDSEISLNKVIKIEYLEFQLYAMIFQNHSNKVSLIQTYDFIYLRTMQMRPLQFNCCFLKTFQAWAQIKKTSIYRDLKIK